MWMKQERVHGGKAVASTEVEEDDSVAAVGAEVGEVTMVGKKISCGICFMDVSVIPLLSFAVAALFVEVVDSKGTSPTDTIEALAAAAAAATGATAAAAAVATEVAVAAAGDTAVATETIGRGQKLNLNHDCCASFMF